MPLPPATGQYPYHLDIGKVIADPLEKEMTFHVVGDSGSAKDLSFQRLMAQQMIKQSYASTGVDKPRFLYHLGDIVYDHGEAHEYASQFFEPFERYPGPIFAIPGNHDAEINPLCETPYESLDAYMQVFCSQEPTHISFAKGSARKSMTQPNVYWTLKTPLATMIGLYGNVAKFGVITAEQREWFIKELKEAAVHKGEQALIVCVHQSPFSADTNHGSSLAMIEFLETAYEAAKVKPDLVLSGHVHNYQRLSKQYANGEEVPYIVAGAGGYTILHSIAEEDDTNIQTESAWFEGVELQRYCTERYGFLKLKIKKVNNALRIIGEYYTIPPGAKPDTDYTAKCFDHFEYSVVKPEAELYVQNVMATNKERAAIQYCSPFFIVAKYYLVSPNHLDGSGFVVQATALSRQFEGLH